MSWTILRAEARLLLRERAFTAAALFLLALIAVAASLGAARTTAERDMIAAARHAEAEQRVAFARDAAAVEAMDPAAAALVRPMGETPGQPFAGAMAGPVGLKLLPVAAALDPVPLSFMAVGLSDVRPAIFNVTASAPYRFMTNYELDNPLLIASGAFDVAFVILFLLPIVVLAGNYNLLSADRDAGIMAMVLAQPVRPAVYVGARLIVRGGAVVLLVLAAWAIALLIGQAAPSGAAVLMLGVWLAYAAFWMALALAINLVVRSAATCGLILAGLWLVFVVIVPAAVSLLAIGTIAAPSRAALTADAREAAQQADRDRAKLLANFFVDHPDMATVTVDPKAGDIFSRGVLLSDAAVSKAVAPKLAAFDRASERRQARVAGFQALSPTLIAQIAIEDIAGRGSTRYAAFKARMLAFNADWTRFFAPRIMAAGRLTANDYRLMPRWQPVSEHAAPIAGLNALMLILLALVTLAIGAACFRRVGRLTP